MKLLIGGTPTGTLAHISARVYRDRCGMLTSWADGAHPKHAIRLGAAWAMDNFAFSGFDADKFERRLERDSGLPGCLFVVAPDVVCDAATTLAQFGQWHDAIKRRGFPIALAIQNGQECLPLPWGDFDALFVGGDNAFKYSDFVGELVIEAHARRVWCHQGRVNSRGRWRYCRDAGFDSTDGTGMVIEHRRVLEALDILNSPERPTWVWRQNLHLEEFA